MHLVASVDDLILSGALLSFSGGWRCHITIKCGYLLELGPFPSRPYCLLNTVVKEEMHMVLVDWSPSSFGRTE